MKIIICWIQRIIIFLFMKLYVEYSVNIGEDLFVKSSKNNIKERINDTTHIVN